jgi:hypothetical protein
MAARRKKKTSKSTALARTNQGQLALPADLADEFAEFMNRGRATAQETGWPFISMRGSTSRMKLGELEIGDDQGVAEIVILGATQQNTLFEGAFNPDQPSGATCYAIADPTAKTEEEITLAVANMGPPADLVSRKSDKCADCMYNAWGSGQGRARACKNTIKVAALAAGSDYGDASGFMFSVPPTSLGNWAKFAQFVLNGMGRPLQSLVVGLRKVMNETRAGFTLTFDVGSVINDATSLRAILARAKGDALAALASPPMLEGAGNGGTAAPKSGTQRRRKVTRKKRTGKK